MYICVVEDADFESHDVATRQKKKACINNVSKFLYYINVCLRDEPHFYLSLVSGAS